MIDLPLFSTPMISRIDACALISYSPAFRSPALPSALTPREKIHDIGDQPLGFQIG